MGEQRVVGDFVSKKFLLHVVPFCDSLPVSVPSPPSPLWCSPGVYFWRGAAEEGAQNCVGGDSALSLPCLLWRIAFVLSTTLQPRRPLSGFPHSGHEPPSSVVGVGYFLRNDWIGCANLLYASEIRSVFARGKWDKMVRAPFARFFSKFTSVGMGCPVTWCASPMIFGRLFQPSQPAQGCDRVGMLLSRAILGSGGEGQERGRQKEG